MKTAGQLLKSAREKKAITLVDVEKATKIRVKYLKALENDQYHLLPSGTYAKGFIKNYAQYLNLPVKTILSIFRRDFTEDDQGQIVPRSMIKPLSDRRFLWTPKATLAAVIAILVLIFVGFIASQYQSLIQPKLEVLVPAEGEIVLGPDISVTGSADPSAVVSVNRQLVVVNADGSFSSQLNLPAGSATVTVEATNNRGYTTTLVRHIEVRLKE